MVLPLCGCVNTGQYTWGGAGSEGACEMVVELQPSTELLLPPTAQPPRLQGQGQHTIPAEVKKDE
jgi:hypothetical protein